VGIDVALPEVVQIVRSVNEVIVIALVVFGKYCSEVQSDPATYPPDFLARVVMAVMS
jgi:hypothetical protein